MSLLLCTLCALYVCCRMYLDDSFDLNDQWMVTRMMYGAQTDAFDYHMVGAI